jgi:DNA polymerase
MKCKRCPLHLSCLNPNVPGHGNPDADLFLVGEAPGMWEDRVGKPFQGQAGKLLDFILAKLSLERDAIWVTNTVRCRPDDNKLPKGEEGWEIIEACWPHLEKELQEVDPKVVVLMGNTPLSLAGLHGIKKHEGMEVESVYDGARTFACFHPAYVLRSPSAEASFGRALWKAAKTAGMKPRALGEEAGRFDYEVRGV